MAMKRGIDKGRGDRRQYGSGDVEASFRRHDRSGWYDFGQQ
jgi:hypothetical protein